MTHEGAPLKAAPEATLLEPGWRQPEPPWTPNFHFQATGRDGIAAIGELPIAALAEVFDLGSHDEVSLGFQRRFLEAAGCTKVFIDHASGSTTKRPELDKLMEYAREGDVLCV